MKRNNSSSESSKEKSTEKKNVDRLQPYNNSLPFCVWHQVLSDFFTQAYFPSGEIHYSQNTARDFIIRIYGVNHTHISEGICCSALVNSSLSLQDSSVNPEPSYSGLPCFIFKERRCSSGVINTDCLVQQWAIYSVQQNSSGVFIS